MDPDERIIEIAANRRRLRAEDDSFSSRVSRPISVSWPEAEELLRRTTLRVFALRLRALLGLLLALERRRIAHPRLGTTPIFKEVLQQGFAIGGMGFDRHFALRSPLPSTGMYRRVLLAKADMIPPLKIHR